MNFDIIKGIFIRDVKRLLHNWVAVVVILGICFLPALYAWFNIGANMDPYQNTGNILIGVASCDEGASSEPTGEINIGDMITDKLKDNDQLGWRIVSKKQALEGVESSEYYASIIIPKDFSQQMLDFLNGSVGAPKLKYYVNEKKNAIAPKVTDTGASTLQTMINQTFLMTASEVVSEIIAEYSGIAVGEIGNAQSQAIMNLEQVKNIISQYTRLNKNASQSISASKNEITKGQQALTQAQKELPIEAAAILGSELTRMNTILASMKDGLTSANRVLIKSNTSLNQISAQVNNTEAEIQAIQGLDVVQKLSELSGLDPNEVSDFMESPIQVESKALYPVKNYGSGMTPFYTMLAIWVSGLVLIAIIHLEVDREGFETASPNEAYLGRWLLYISIGLIQAVVICLGDILLLGVQCKHPLLFCITGLVASVCFVSLIYALAVSFRHIGKALAVILVILQIPGSSGTYPTELLGAFFQKLSPFLPFTYGINAMREAIAGLYRNYYINNLLILVVFTAVAMFIGLVVRTLMLNLNRVFDIELGKTGLIETEEIGQKYENKKFKAAARILMGDKRTQEKINEARERFEAKYQQRAGRGILLMITIPMALMFLMFFLEAKMIMLTIWIITFIGLDVYLIMLVFIHRRNEEEAEETEEIVAAVEARVEAEVAEERAEERAHAARTSEERMRAIARIIAEERARAAARTPAERARVEARIAEERAREGAKIAEERARAEAEMAEERARAAAEMADERARAGGEVTNE